VRRGLAANYKNDQRIEQRRADQSLALNQLFLRELAKASGSKGDEFNMRV